MFTTLAFATLAAVAASAPVRCPANATLATFSNLAANTTLLNATEPVNATMATNATCLINGTYYNGTFYNGTFATNSTNATLASNATCWIIPTNATNATAPLPVESSAEAESSQASLPEDNLAAKPSTEAASSSATEAATSSEAPSATPSATSESSASPSASPSTTPSTGSGSYTGEATYYAVGLGACGWTNSDSEMVVALNAPMWEGGAHCGEYVTITNGGKTQTAKIVDLCPGCASGDLDMSETLFNAVIGESGIGRAEMSWSYSGEKSSEAAPNFS